MKRKKKEPKETTKRKDGILQCVFARVRGTLSLPSSRHIPLALSPSLSAISLGWRYIFLFLQKSQFFTTIFAKHAPFRLSSPRRATSSCCQGPRVCCASNPTRWNVAGQTARRRLMPHHTSQQAWSSAPNEKQDRDKREHEERACKQREHEERACKQLRLGFSYYIFGGWSASVVYIALAFARIRSPSRTIDALPSRGCGADVSVT